MSTGIGEALREAREDKGRSIEEAAQVAGVRRTDYLRALEDEDFDVFGGDVYAKGFLSTYARSLDLDPNPLLDEYRRSVQDDDVSTRLATGAVASGGVSGPPTWVAWAVVAVVILGGIVALGQVVGGRAPSPADEEADVPPQPVASGTPTGTPTPGTGAPGGGTSPSPTPAAEGVELLLVVEERCWMRVTIDDQTVFQDTVEAGETVTYQDDEQITVRFGAPAGVRAEVNGEDLGSVGEAGEPVTVEFTPEGMSQPA